MYLNRLHIRILLLIIALIHGSWLFGQEKGMLSGRVLDAESGEPMVAVNISVDRHTGTTSDLNGEFSLGLDAGDHLVEFYYVGYEGILKKILVREGETLRLDIQMRSSGIPQWPVHTLPRWES